MPTPLLHFENLTSHFTKRLELLLPNLHLWLTKTTTNTSYDAEENDLLSDGMIGAEVILAHGGEQNQIAHVKERKRDSHGILIGTKQHDNPTLDSHLYTVEYDDGHQEDYAYNAIVEALYSQCDEFGNKYYTISDIIGHTRDAKAGKGKTKGWRLEVEWKDGSSTWETLSSLKETAPAEVAKYAADHQLQDEPAFKWWVPHVLCKYDRIIKLNQSQ